MLQLVFPAAGAQQRQKEDRCSCALIATDLYSAVRTAGPHSFSLYLKTSPVLLNLSAFIYCSLSHSQKCPLTTHTMNILLPGTTADLPPHNAVPQPLRKVCGYCTFLLCWHSHISCLLNEKLSHCSFTFSENEPLIACTPLVLWWRQRL